MADVRRAAAAIAIVVLWRKSRKKRTKTVREKEWLRRRTVLGVYRELLPELRLEDPEHYRKYLCMDTAAFEVILRIGTLCSLQVNEWEAFIVQNSDGKRFGSNFLSEMLQMLVEILREVTVLVASCYM